MLCSNCVFSEQCTNPVMCPDRRVDTEDNDSDTEKDYSFLDVYAKGGDK